MVDRYTLADFEEFRRDSWLLKFTEDVALEATICDITKVNTASRRQSDSFSVTFQTKQKGQYYTQCTIPVEHPRMGEIRLFLVPIGPCAETVEMQYQATFN